MILGERDFSNVHNVLGKKWSIVIGLSNGSMDLFIQYNYTFGSDGCIRIPNALIKL